MWLPERDCQPAYTLGPLDELSVNYDQTARDTQGTRFSHLGRPVFVDA